MRPAGDTRPTTVHSAGDSSPACRARQQANLAGRLGLWNIGRASALLGLLLLTLLVAAPAGARPRCFGAAARGAGHPCHNSRLRLTVTPTPEQAPLIPNVPCTPAKVTDAMGTCELGAPPERATATVALVGDSHTQHLRPAVAYVAARRRWHVVDITIAHCQLTTTPSGLGPPFPTLCPQWTADVMAWLGAHPEVHTLITSGKVDRPIAPPPGVAPFTARVNGFLEAWAQLPPTLTNLVVIRDIPRNRYTTAPCVTRALKRRVAPGEHCAITRSFALPPDPMIASAGRRGARTIDLSSHFCDARRCYPVVGGVLVHRDPDGHLTKAFARTLGPFLDRALPVG
jgi:hypothetical protein